ncbi:GIP [Symbiodinium sp. CCMP2592]|nr:GIP [Symbiodinium sp. CCMP2592]
MAIPDVAPASSEPSDVRAAAEPRTQSAETVDEFVKTPDDDQSGEWSWEHHSWGDSGWRDDDRWGGRRWWGPQSWNDGRSHGDHGRRTSWDNSWEGGSTETAATANGGSWTYQGDHDDYEEEPHDPWADGRDGLFQGRDSRLRHRQGSWGERPPSQRDYGDVVWDGWRHYTGGSFTTRSEDDKASGETWKAGKASEKLVVPTFSGEDGDDVGNSARSYLREVEAWRRLTHLPQSQQGLVLYRHLAGKAWVAAEELNVDALGRSDGVQYLLGWMRERYLDLEVTRIGKAFSDMFRKLKRRAGQSVRDYNSEYDRLHARLRETGCRLPEECAAWLYVDRLNLEEGAELNLLASVGNEYSLGRLQKAAIIQDRGLRKPWEGGAGKGARRPYTAHVTDNAEGDPEISDEELDGMDDIPEDVAVAYVTYQSAKNRYRDQVRSRGYQGQAEATATTTGNSGGRPPRADDSGAREEKIRLMKSRSFCSSCGKKGHWHKDKECPNNNGGGAADGPKDVKMCNIMPAQVLALRHVGGGEDLLAIADTACARTVAGTQWVQDYMDKLPPDAPKPSLLRECEAYRFGTGKIMYSSFYVVISFRLGQKVVRLRTSVINGDIPLLVSRTVLSKLGMIYDIEQGTADFTKVGLSGFELLSTASGHPAIPIVPVVVDGGNDAALPVEEPRLESREPYTAFAVGFSSRKAHMYNIYHDKKLDPAVKSMLTQCRLPREAFMSWWKHCRVPGDFWIETECSWVRVHLTPRRAMYNPAMWGSSATLQKQMLLSSLGEIRVTEAVCCSSERWLEDVVDTWNQKATSESTLPLLWIGRTIFNKRSPPRDIPLCDQPVAISKMTKTQLLEEALRLGLTVHKSWSPEEIKAIIMEHRESVNEKDAQSLDIQFPSNITKGNLLNLVRDSLNTPDNELMKIGRYRGREFREIPHQYGVWAMNEIKSSQTADDELIRFARWFEAKLQRNATYTGSDLASSHPGPYPGTESSAGSSWRGVWEENLPARAVNMGEGPGRDRPKRATAEADHATYEKDMDDEPNAKTLDEIRKLETRLALLKDKARTKSGN